MASSCFNVVFRVIVLCTFVLGLRDSFGVVVGGFVVIVVALGFTVVFGVAVVLGVVVFGVVVVVCLGFAVVFGIVVAVGVVIVVCLSLTVVFGVVVVFGFKVVFGFAVVNVVEVLVFRVVTVFFVSGSGLSLSDLVVTIVKLVVTAFPSVRPIVSMALFAFKMSSDPS